MHTPESRSKISRALKGKPKSESHRAAIASSMRGKKHSESTILSIKEHLQRSHHRRCEWILINPSNEIIRTQRLREFCDQNLLSYSAFRRAHAVGSGCAIARGASAGWIVFAVKQLKTKD
jgi:hypothetical protein